jgi:hypothetical protein
MLRLFVEMGSPQLFAQDNLGCLLGSRKVLPSALCVSLLSGLSLHLDAQTGLVEWGGLWDGKQKPHTLHPFSLIPYPQSVCHWPGSTGLG